MKTVEELRGEYANFIGRMRDDAKSAVQGTSQKEMLTRLKTSISDLNVHILAIGDLLEQKRIITEEEYLSAILLHLQELH